MKPSKPSPRMEQKYKQIIGEFKRNAIAKYRNQIDSIRVYGSVARDQATGDSDIDLLVITKRENIKLAKDIVGIGFELLIKHHIYPSVKVYSRREFQNKKKDKIPFILNVLKEGIQIA